MKKEQERIVVILNKFDALVNIPALIGTPLEEGK
jgi:hypothetical protein